MFGPTVVRTPIGYCSTRVYIPIACPFDPPLQPDLNDSHSYQLTIFLFNFHPSLAELCNSDIHWLVAYQCHGGCLRVALLSSPYCKIPQLQGPLSSRASLTLSRYSLANFICSRSTRTRKTIYYENSPSPPPVRGEKHIVDCFVWLSFVNYWLFIS